MTPLGRCQVYKGLCSPTATQHRGVIINRLAAGDTDARRYSDIPDQERFCETESAQRQRIVPIWQRDGLRNGYLPTFFAYSHIGLVPPMYTVYATCHLPKVGATGRVSFATPIPER